jgi:hypothetical protein
VNVQRVALVFPYPINPGSAKRTEFNSCARRFAETYRQFPPEWEHRLYVVCSNGEIDQECRDTFSGIDVAFDRYDGGGWDIGCEQHMARKIEEDFCVSMTTRTYFHRSGWLKRLIEARNTFGSGLYGSTGSNEVYPHIRTAFYGVDTWIFKLYPHTIDTRDLGFFFESEEGSFTEFVKCIGRPCLMVTWDGVYSQPDWRKPPNIFRSGDQSNLLAWDRHSLIYARADATLRAELKGYADGTLKRELHPQIHNRIWINHFGGWAHDELRKISQAESLVGIKNEQG